MSEQRIFALFSTPLYVNNVGDFARPDLKSLEYTSSAETGGVYNFRTSVDKNVLHRPEFKTVHDVVMKEVDVYAHGVCGVSRKVEFYVTNSWVNVHSRGQAAGQHIHGNSLISVDLTPEGKGTKLVFTHEQLPTSTSRDNHAKGWTGCLDRLANALAR